MVFDKGPGAASAIGPEFEEPKFQRALTNYHETIQNAHNLSITGDDVAFYNENGPSMMAGFKRDAIGKLLEHYRNDPVFKRFADGARHYVHNNPEIIDASRGVLGMERKARLYESTPGRKGWSVRPLRMLDGKLENSYFMEEKTGYAIAEDLLSSIRNAPEQTTPLMRGMWFDTSSSTGLANYKKFVSLNPGDVIDLPLSSFSDDFDVVNNSFLQQGKGDVLFRLEGPHKSVSVKPFNSVREGEFITQGQFEVVSKKAVDIPMYSDEHGKIVTGPRRIEITLRQKGVF